MSGTSLGFFVIFICFIGSICGQSIQGVDVVYTGRQLLENPTQAPSKPDNATFFNTSCAMLYIKQITIKVYDTTNVKTPILHDVNVPQITDTTEAECLNNTVLIKFESKSLPSVFSYFGVQLNFSKEGKSEWVLSSMSVTLTCVTPNKCTPYSNQVVKKSSAVSAPTGYSYHCMDHVFTIKHNYTAKIVTELKFKKFQAQVFKFHKAGKFGYPNDCVGFFTIPIWTSLFVTFLLLSILSFGLYMVMDIHTMDRFDDPKGKGVQLGTNE